MPSVNFDVFTAKPLTLDSADAEALAVIVERLDGQPLANRILYGLANNALVQVEDDERQLLIDALAELLPTAANAAQVTDLSESLHARMVAGDIHPPPVFDD